MNTTVLLIVLFALLAGLGVGAAIVAWSATRQRAVMAQLVETQQAAAVETAVRQVLLERRATAEAVTADREQMVTAAVDQAVKIATSTLDAKLQEGSRELGLRSDTFSQSVGSVTAQLDKVQQLIAELQRDKASQHGTLVEQLQQNAQRSMELHATTAQLRDALASPKSRGQWGERMAEDVLAAAGFREGINYRKQTAVAGGGVPDFTFVLPRGLELDMDVKFPVDNYLRFLEAGDDLERDRCRSAFARDVRARVKELRDRGYIDPERTVDTMVLFIPNESVYAFVHENDADLIDIALKHKIVLCSPLTLFSVLAIIRQAVDNFRLERRSGEILEVLVDFRTEWGRFTDHLDKTGRQLDTFNKSFEGLAGTRRNQLERRLRTIDELEAEHAGRADLVELAAGSGAARPTAAGDARPAGTGTGAGSRDATAARPASEGTLDWDSEVWDDAAAS
jgi:DNA recombination protein RmuC